MQRRATAGLLPALVITMSSAAGYPADGPDDLDIRIALTRDGDVREHRLVYRRGFAAHPAE
jgi:hypothetical protein